MEPCDAAGEGRLAAPRLADEGEALLRPDGEAHVEHHFTVGVGGPNAAGGEKAHLPALLTLRGLDANALQNSLREHVRGPPAADVMGGRHLRHGREGLPALLDRERAAWGEEAPGWAVARRRCPTRDPDQGVAPGDVGDRLDELARVGMRGCPEKLVRRPALDDTPGVHDRDTVGDERDDGEVVADVERGDAVRLAELAYRLEHVRLGRHVEPGRRLVEDDHARPAGEGHRESDPLLLAAGELMRVAAQELSVGREEHLCEHLAESGSALLGGGAVAVSGQRLHELSLDPEGGVERGRRVLRDV